ncbi:hypothetical protein [Blastococcus sp. TF02A-30]|uniref:hypothetical protein n=1 Tax=Blastococcus sp. TF02A-30 TaxID=2250580 RepID=UPI000DE87F8C|nr:hypothetical protein [Blastococcus sp. TF02A-30]RBY89370.1 hypothetical protein DQ241_07795 [Blastococcus sp. TF02A-30]
MTDPAEWRLQRLEARIDRLERAVVQGVAWLSAALLVVGVLLPYMGPEEWEEADERDPDQAFYGNLLVVPFKIFGFRNSEGEAEGGGYFFGTCYLGLLVVIGVALWVLYRLGSGQITERTGRFARIVAGFLVVGVLGALPFPLLCLPEDNEGTMGPAILVVAAGAVVFLLLVTRLSDRWDPERGAARPRSSLRSTAP